MESDDESDDETPSGMYDYHLDHIARVTQLSYGTSNSVISEVVPAGTTWEEIELKSPFETTVYIENHGNNDIVSSKVHFNVQSEYATAPLYHRQYARSVEILAPRNCRKFTDSCGNVVMSSCVIELDFRMNTWPSHVLFPSYKTPGNMTIRFYCVCIDHMSIPLKVLHQTVNCHIPADIFRIPPNLSRFGPGRFDMDRYYYRFLHDPMSTGVVYTMCRCSHLTTNRS